MKKLIYFKKFNEASTKVDLDFETFKDIMLDISDYFPCQFQDYGDNKEYPYFYCEVSLQQQAYTHNDEVDLTTYYLTGHIQPSEDPGEINFEEINRLIDRQIDNLERLRNDLNPIIDINKRIKKILKILQDDIIPRFQTFDNFEKCLVGYENQEYPTISISFDIKGGKGWTM